jgi:hypothetical protein
LQSAQVNGKLKEGIEEEKGLCYFRSMLTVAVCVIKIHFSVWIHVSLDKFVTVSIWNGGSTFAREYEEKNQFGILVQALVNLF